MHKARAVRLVRTRLKRLLRAGFYLLPRNRALYRLCKRYVDDYHGDCNCDMYTNGELRFLRRNLRRQPGTVIFDVGANRGEWCQAVLSINPSAEIHCFEPSRYSFERLMAKNLPDNVICNNFGLSSSSSSQEMFIFGQGYGQNSLYSRYDHEPQTRERVRLETLADYCTWHNIERIDFVKIDTEGHEIDVLMGSEELLSHQRIRIVQFEYGECFVAAGVLLKDIVEFMAEFSYDLYKIMPRGLWPIYGYDTQLENFLNSNYVLISRDGGGKAGVLPSRP